MQFAWLFVASTSRFKFARACLSPKEQNVLLINYTSGLVKSINFE